MSKTMQNALAAAENGIYVFPCSPNDKKPLITGWPEHATTDPKQITNWWQHWPDAMIGAVTGEKSGFFVLDIDVKDGVDAFTKLNQLEERYGKIDSSYMVKTPSGGLHIYMAMPSSGGVRNSASKLGAGIDIRANGGYVIFAGSVRADGKTYSFTDKEVSHAV